MRWSFHWFPLLQACIIKLNGSGLWCSYIADGSGFRMRAANQLNHFLMASCWACQLEHTACCRSKMIFLGIPDLKVGHTSQARRSLPSLLLQPAQPSCMFFMGLAACTHTGLRDYRVSGFVGLGLYSGTMSAKNLQACMFMFQELRLQGFRALLGLNLQS